MEARWEALMHAKGRPEKKGGRHQVLYPNRCGVSKHYCRKHNLSLDSCRHPDPQYSERCFRSIALEIPSTNGRALRARDYFQVCISEVAL